MTPPHRQDHTTTGPSQMPPHTPEDHAAASAHLLVAAAAATTLTTAALDLIAALVHVILALSTATQQPPRLRENTQIPMRIPDATGPGHRDNHQYDEIAVTVVVVETTDSALLQLVLDRFTPSVNHIGAPDSGDETRRRTDTAAINEPPTGPVIDHPPGD